MSLTIAFLEKMVGLSSLNPNTNQRLRHIEGKKTMRDLCRKLNLHSPRWYMPKRSLAYLGHLARYPGGLLEQNVLRIFF